MRFKDNKRERGDDGLWVWRKKEEGEEKRRCIKVCNVEHQKQPFPHSLVN
jgi:hypothetical protein